MPYAFALILSLTLLSGCQSAYYSAMESVGVHKRDIMVDRVEDATEAQQDAQEQFTSALAALQSLTRFEGGTLEETYNRVNAQYEASADAADKVSDRIAAIENVSQALFDEWQEELSLYSSAALRRDSEAKLKATRASYSKMIAAMHRAESKMAPVLDTLRDNSLYLKHNLNAAAIGSLQGEFRSLERDIQRAISDMRAAISESERFVAQLNRR
ncbi:DUF2959 domain-containing protein [Photobacterium halotolerans]|uniref:DUF2959 family protein n=1 Tax=Photobacterium halotolerans TaxID=265726 RepID=A0A7X5AYF4_9GAMM|nr:DUF2959 domain-containing protein [Photobacterium halotolerans]NAW67601.1 DUF2959 family protein [Photobacterium halotolerans]NAW86600.1 DUF2959 family protein [Photobacterium halotolerans]NAX47256.1 DUF2959 family protein [Photobacterium halotolerans]